MREQNAAVRDKLNTTENKVLELQLLEKRLDQQKTELEYELESKEKFLVTSEKLVEVKEIQTLQNVGMCAVSFNAMFPGETHGIAGSSSSSRGRESFANRPGKTRQFHLQ